MADAKPFSDEEITTMKGARICGDGLSEIDLLPEQTVRALLKKATISEGRFLDTTAADRKQLQECEDDLASFKKMMFDLDKTNEENYKRIEELEATIDRLRDNRYGEGIKAGLTEANKDLVPLMKENERLRDALEPFSPSYDITVDVPEVFGIFLGGLTKRNFVDAQKALAERRK